MVLLLLCDGYVVEVFEWVLYLGLVGVGFLL